ncbi:MAG TPA: hypothetical protein PLP29_12510 [Candidatus Ozemobacteraceae bacterium]|mgnify:CR=1 FL=1|nr:hypothetical protein [Candidatus Ozemobacteraceae bacterium]
MKNRHGRSTIEWLLIVGIATSFLWPFMQLWSVQAVPLIESETQQKAAATLVNLMEEALARPQRDYFPTTEFEPIPGLEAIGLEGKTEIMPHPDYTDMTLVRVQVRWGFVLFRKQLTLETALTRIRP